MTEFEVKDIIGNRNVIDGQEFGDFYLIIAVSHFSNRVWYTYARLCLYGDRLEFDRCYVITEHKLLRKLKYKKGTFELLPKDYFEEKGIDICDI